MNLALGAATRSPAAVHSTGAHALAPAIRQDLDPYRPLRIVRMQRFGHPHRHAKITADAVHAHDIWYIRCVLFLHERVECQAAPPSNIADLYPVVFNRDACSTTFCYLFNQIIINYVFIQNAKNNCYDEKRPHKKLSICHGSAP